MPRPCLCYPPWCLCLLVVFCAGHAVMLVGGAVRDLLLGCKPKDYDLLTSAHIAEVRSGILWQPDNVLFVEPSAMRALAPSGYRLFHAPTHGASRLACIHTQHCIAVHVGVDGDPHHQNQTPARCLFAFAFFAFFTGEAAAA